MQVLIDGGQGHPVFGSRQLHVEPGSPIGTHILIDAGGPTSTSPVSVDFGLRRDVKIGPGLLSDAVTVDVNGGASKQVWATPITVEVSNPKTASAEIVSIMGHLAVRRAD